MEAKQWDGSMQGADDLEAWSAGNVCPKVKEGTLEPLLLWERGTGQYGEKGCYVVRYDIPDFGIWHQVWDEHHWEALKPILERLSVNPWELPKVNVFYKNHAGKFAIRTISPLRVWYGATHWHPTEQWLMDVWDYGHNKARTFAIRDCDFQSKVDA